MIPPDEWIHPDEETPGLTPAEESCLEQFLRSGHPPSVPAEKIVFWLIITRRLHIVRLRQVFSIVERARFEVPGIEIRIKWFLRPSRRPFLLRAINPRMDSGSASRTRDAVVAILGSHLHRRSKA